MRAALIAAIPLALGVAAAAQPAAGPPGPSQELRFLDGMRFQPGLGAAIRDDAARLPPAEARASIINRLRADQLGNGALPTETIQRFRPDLAGTARDVQLTLRGAARVPAPLLEDRLRLRELLPDLDVERIERSRQTLFQVRPGIDVGTPPTGPSLPTGLDAGWQNTPQIVRPGIDGPLADCAIPFDRLPATCADEGPGQRCERYDSRQFSQVIYLTRANEPHCTGTYVGGNFVLTAAHCFLPDRSTAAHRVARPDLANGGDPYLDTEAQVRAPRIQLDFPNAGVASNRDRFPDIRRVYVHPGWEPGQINDSVSLNDLALVQADLSDELKAQVQHAEIADASYSGRVTTAGFGMTTLVQRFRFAVTWPDASVRPAHNRLELGKAMSTFCSGDSGGPAFQGVQRGCLRPVADDPLPRRVVGVVSYHGGRVTGPQDCQSSALSAFSDVGLPQNRQWICRVSHDAVAGCR